MITRLKSAIIVLSKHHEFLQVPTEQIINIAAMLQWQFHKHASMLKGMITPREHKMIAAFVQSPGDYFDAEPTFKQSYAPQSGQIFGILKQMKETFETNLGTSQKEEMQAQAAYEDLKAAKEEEIKAGTELKDSKTQELADTDEKNVNAKTDLEDTRNSLSADQKFLMNLKETCQMTDQEWEERQKSRAEEIKGVSEALAILTSDDAHDTFTRTFNFVQVRMRSRATRARDSASKMLFSAAKKYSNPRLAALATRVRLDAFTKVKAAEIKHKDFCVEGLNTNERETELKQRDIEELEAKISDLTTQIDELTKSIATLSPRSPRCRRSSSAP